MDSCLPEPQASPAPPPQSSTVRASGARKKGGLDQPAGFDARRKINRKKRQILGDTRGLLLHTLVHSAGVQDRDGGILVMATLFGLHPFLLKLYDPFPSDWPDSSVKVPLQQALPTHVQRCAMERAAERAVARERQVDGIEAPVFESSD